ncbi:hypothetical protein B0H14DRAFT_3139615 [Mycena olivaceomarginata]|nr:hypothetical protein B0H14DRAFT_3139615 [Mycena olivaceomarginata]
MPASPAVGPIQSKKEKIGRCGLISIEGMAIESRKFLVFSGTAVTARGLAAPPPSTRGAPRRSRPLNRPRQRKGDPKARARDGGVNYASARIGHHSSFGMLQTRGRIEERSTDGTSTGAVDVETKRPVSERRCVSTLTPHKKDPFKFHIVSRTVRGLGDSSEIKGVPGCNGAQTVEITPPETQMCCRCSAKCGRRSPDAKTEERDGRRAKEREHRYVARRISHEVERRN